MKRGLILFAHGARDPRWAEPFNAIAERVRLREPGLIVQLAFLELMKPSMADAGQTLIEAGCEAVDVVPLFLGAGGHVRNDLPVLVDALSTRYPDVRWRLQMPIGEVDSVIDAIANAAAASTSELLKK